MIRRYSNPPYHPPCKPPLRVYRGRNQFGAMAHLHFKVAYADAEDASSSMTGARKKRAPLTMCGDQKRSYYILLYYAIYYIILYEDVLKFSLAQDPVAGTKMRCRKCRPTGFRVYHSADSMGA